LYKVDEFVSHFEKKDIEITTIIDLSYTNRYYDPTAFPTTVKHVKIEIQGQKNPSELKIQEFIKTVSESKGFVGVHCTHGLNRTGYLVCCYLIEKKGFSVPKAISAFNRAREDEAGFHKVDYINNLFERYKQTDDPMYKDILKYPATPNWSKHYSAYYWLVKSTPKKME